MLGRELHPPDVVHPWEQGGNRLLARARRSGRCGEQGGRAKSGEGDRVRAKQRHLQPFALVAERLVCRTVFAEPLRRTVGREVPYQSEVPAPDLSIVGGLVDAEHSERITHHSRLRRAVGAWRGWLPSIAIATTA